MIRNVFNSGPARDRETVLREVSQALGYDRLGSHIREIFDRDLRTAVRRGILQNHGGELSLLGRSIEQYERGFLKDQFLAALDRAEAARTFARWLGFTRTGTVRSLIRRLLREGRLESDGANVRRTPQTQ